MLTQTRKTEAVCNAWRLRRRAGATSAVAILFRRKEFRRTWSLGPSAAAG
jgi:hypothetical protein